MKKVLIPVFVMLSSTYAFADGMGGGLAGGIPSTSSTVGLRQTINCVAGSAVANDASVGQLALGIGHANVSASTNVRQGISNVSNSIAVNNAEVSNIAVGANP